MNDSNHYSTIVVGASAGGVETFSNILSKLPQDFSLAMIFCLHLPERPKNVLPELLANYSKVPIKEAEDKESIKQGHIYTAPEGYHLLIERDGTFSLSTEDPVNFSRPSIDVLFESAAYALDGKLIGVLLTGGSHDGAAGLDQIHQRGGLTIVQNPLSALASQMPEAAIAIRQPDHLMTPSEIAAFVAGLKNGALQ